MTEDKDLYLDLMKRSLTGLLWDQEELFEPINMTLRRPFYKRGALHFLAKRLAKTGKQIVQPAAFDLETRLKGGDWSPPPFAYTMIGMKRLDNLQTCIEDVIENNVPGDLIETGVWRGGATIFMRAVLKAYGITERCVWAADSFEGLPAPDPVKYPADEHDTFHQVEEIQSASGRGASQLRSVRPARRSSALSQRLV
jgi:hypothetical protein